MLIRVNKAVAMRCGLNAAVVADYLWQSFAEDEPIIREGKHWIRRSKLMMSLELSFFTEEMIKGALNRLIKDRVIQKGNFNESRFDRTLWYTFTPFGRKLMETMQCADGNEKKENL